jgi:hypothetical protein
MDMIIYQQYFMRIFRHKIECLPVFYTKLKTKISNSLGGHIVVLRSAEKIVSKEAAYFYTNCYYHTNFQDPDLNAVGVSHILYDCTFSMLVLLIALNSI